MKANELRIGNLLTFDGYEAEVTAIPEGEFYEDNKFQPIPLTEEWLVRFGFDKHYDNEFLLGNYSIRYGLLYYNGYRCHEVGINSVHSLQNLYFALTDEELKTKQA